MCDRVESYISDVAGSLPDMQELSVFPAEIIKILALVRVERQGLIKCVV